MAKQLNVNVAVTADTSQAKAQLEALQNSLTKLTSNSANLKVGLNASEIAKAVTEIDKLQVHLKNATNLNTGTLDFSKLNASIKASGSTLQDYGNQLLRLGPQGQQAFSQLTAAIAKSEVPMSRMKGLLGEFGTVLTNTIRWQAASSAIHGMMGSIQHAFSYAQQLNESLNRIQIVTQASDSHMAQFAEQANKAAKALNTTTTAYTNAALIYYQQGLSDKEVAERNATTIKLANISGQSAEKVSNQMTAIWNNFDDGTRSLESYADVITALGAATASSSEEIATGLQKFAAVADTVGLSYDHATAALATITATTRQSADTVGTGLRTLFARLQSLQLGETLDDGVTLTKYSKALDKIGVKVLDYAGNLRSADDILADMGSKWEELTNAQKTAVAQTVGGVRQYTTIMALMDNFDMYENNIKIAENSQGTVQAQADIYAKSWEAAKDRVKVASESLYSNLIDDKFFIALNNGFAGFLNLLDQIIDGFGGLKTLLPGIAALLTNLFSGQIANGLVNFATTIKSLAPGAAERDRTERNTYLDQAARTMLNISQSQSMSQSQATQYGYARDEIELQRQYAARQGVMSESDKQLAQMALDRYSNLRNEYSQNEAYLQQHKYQRATARSALRGKNLFADNPKDFGDWLDKDQKQYDKIKAHRKTSDYGKTGDADKWFDQNHNFDNKEYWRQAGKGIEDFTANINQLDKAKQAIEDFGKNSGDSIDTLKTKIDTLKGIISDTDIDEIKQRLESNVDAKGNPTEEARADAEALIKEIQEEHVTDFANAWGFNREAVAAYKDEIIACNGSIEKQKELVDKIKAAQKEATDAVNKQNKQLQTAQNITNLASGLMSVTTAATSASSAISNMMEQGKTGALSFSSVISGGLVPTLMSVMTAMSAIDKLSKVSFLAGLPIGGIVTAVMAVVAAVTIINSIVETDEEKIERLNSEAEEATTAANNAKAAYDRLLSNKSAHNELLGELDRMINKTNEFRAKLEEANAVARDIINENGLIYGKDYTYDENSIIRFNEGVLDNVESQRNNFQNRAALISSLSTYQADSAAQAYEKQKEVDAAYAAMDKNAVTKDSEYQDASKFINYFNDALLEYLGSNAFSGEDPGAMYEAFLKEVNPNNSISYDEWFKRAHTAADSFGASSNINLHEAIGKAYESATINTNPDYTIPQIQEELNNFLGAQSTEVQQALADQEVIGQSQYTDILSKLAYQNDNEVSNEENLILDYLSKNYNYKDAQERLASALTELDEQGFKSNMDEAQILEKLTKDENGRYQFNGKEFNINEFLESEDYKKITDIGQKGKALYDYIAKNLQIEKIDEQLNDLLKSNLFKNADEIIAALGEDFSERSVAQMATYDQDIINQLLTQGTKLSDEEIKYIQERGNTLAEEAKNNAQDILNGFFGLGEDGKPNKDVENYLNISLKNWSQAKSISSLGTLFKENLKDNDFATMLGDALFGEDGSFNKTLANRLSTVDLTSPLSALVDLKHLRNIYGPVEDSLDDIYVSLYQTALEKFGGKSGVFSEIFGAEDFQKELKKVQKEFKKTGKVSTKNVDDIADSCEDLNDILDENILSAGAVADAIMLYSEGAVSDIANISDELWNALEAANALQDGLRNAFNFIDNWEPDRSVADIGDFFGKQSKDYFTELGNGTVGSNRLYQTAQMLWGNGKAGEKYTQQMMSFFLGQENKNYNPYEAQAAYNAQFGKFDKVWQQVQKDGHLGAYWNFLLDSGNKTTIQDTLGIDQQALKDLGITQGNAGAININTTPGQTTKDFTKQLADILGLSPEMAEVYAQELIGHSAGARFDFESADIMEGWGQLRGKKGPQGKLDRALFGEANKTMLDMMSAEYESLSGKSYRTDAEEQRFNWLKDHKNQIDAATKAAETYESAMDKVNTALEEGTSITENLTKEEKELVQEQGKIGTTEESVTWDNGEEGTITKGVYGAGTIGKEVIETQEDFEAATKAAKDLGGVYGEVMSDGSIVTAEANDTLETFQQRVKDTEKQIKSAEAKQFGKDLFGGIFEAIQELGDTKLGDTTKEIITSLADLAQAISSFDGSAESAQALKDSIAAFTGLSEATIPEGLATGIGEIITNISSAQGASASATDLKKAIDILKEALATQIEGTTISEAITGAMNALIAALSSVDSAAQATEEKAEKLEQALERLRKAMGEYAAAGGGGETGPTTSPALNNDRIMASGIAYTTYDQQPTEAPFMGGPPLGSVLTPENDFNFPQRGGNESPPTVELSDQTIGNMTTSLTTAVTPAVTGGTVTRQGNNKVAINGSTYDLNGTGYSSDQVTGLIDQIAQASYNYNDSKASMSEREDAKSLITSLTSQLGDLLTDIQKNVKPEEKKDEDKTPKKEGKLEDTPTDKDATVKNVKAEVTEAEMSDNAPPLDVPNAEADSVEAPDVEPVEVPVEPEEGTEDLLDDVDASIQVEMNPETGLIESFTAQTADKTVDLLLGANEPQDAIDNLPSSHTLSLAVHVSVSGGNAFGASINFSGGGEILGAALGTAIDGLATHYATNHPAMRQFIEMTRKHYQEGQEGCQHSKGTCRGGGGPSGASGMATYHSYVNGSANRYGKPGISLTAEEGPEIIWNKMGGYAYIVGGEGHPEFAYLQPGDRVFNANDTREILNYHRPKSNYNSPVRDPRDMSNSLFGSHAAGSAYGSYGPQSTYGRGGRGGGADKGNSKEFKPERYHLITRQIQDLTFWYDELKKARENAYGVNVLDSIDKEIAATDELVKANQELLNQAEDYLTKDLAKLDELKIAYELDEAGNIKNFDELQQEYKKKVDEDKDENAQKAWDAITQYEETLDKLQEVKAELSDALYDYSELRLEKIQVKAEIKVDFDERELKYIDHFIKKIDDDIYATADVLKMVSSQMGLINNKINTTRAAVDDIFANMTDRYGNPVQITYEQFVNMSEAEREALDINGKYGEQLEKYADDLLTYIEALEDYKTKGVEELSAAFDELNDNLTYQLDLFEHYSTMLSSLRDITDLQGIKLPKEFRDTITKINQSMISVTKDQIKALQTAYAGYEKSAAETRQKLAETTDETLRKKYQEQLKGIEEDMRKNKENMLSLWQDGLSKAKDMFDSTMEWIKEDYNASLSDMYEDATQLQDAFDRKKELNEEYVDDYEKYYQLGKLQRQINKDLDTAAINGNKQNKNLKALLEEIQKLQKDGTEMSAYDLDILAKKYEYEKALADLEDARNAKQTVRLQRDRNGNWGYVYTAADGDELAEQEQAVEDKLYEYTKAATEQSKELQSQILGLWAEAGEKVAQMRAEGVSDAVIEDYIADVQQKLQFLMAQLEKTGTDVSAVLPKWISLTNDSFNLTTDTFKETILSVVTGMETVQQTGETISSAILTIAEATKVAVNDYNASIAALNKTVTGSGSGYNSLAEAWAAALAEASKQNTKDVENAVNELTSVYSKVLKAAKDFEKEFMETYEPIIARNEAFLSQLLNALGQLNGLPNNEKALEAARKTSSDHNVGVASYDTGGFTGSWGPDGKLAFLHEREEVFNKDDTTNLLEAANILRVLDMQAGNFEKGLGNLFNPTVKDFNQTIEQDIQIIAEFPNAVNHSEIEEAFNNLANRATQYANRKVG